MNHIKECIMHCNSYSKIASRHVLKLQKCLKSTVFLFTQKALFFLACVHWLSLNKQKLFWKKVSKIVPDNPISFPDIVNASIESFCPLSFRRPLRLFFQAIIPAGAQPLKRELKGAKSRFPSYGPSGFCHTFRKV